MKGSHLRVPISLDAQLEDYLLANWQRRKRAECKDNFGTLWSMKPSNTGCLRDNLKLGKVMMTAREVEASQLEGDVVFKEYESTTGQVIDSVIIQLHKKGSIYILVYRQPQIKLILSGN